MEFPFGHHSHTHHHHERREEDYPAPPPGHYPPPPGHYPPPGQFPRPPFEQPPPPPPMFYAENEPPRQETYVYHSSHVGGGPDYYDRPAPPPPAGPGYSSYSDPFSHPPPPAPAAGVQHVSHHGFDESENRPHHGRPHMPSFIHHHTHHHGPEATSKPTVRVFTKAKESYSLTIRDSKVILAPSDPSDPFQHWIKDEKFSIRVKDEEGFPSFALINQATGQAMKHSIGATHPVQLIPYNPDVLDESVLWSESRDLGDGFRTIRMVNNIRLNVDAFHGDKNHGGVHDGTTIVLWEWKKGENQRWKIVPYCKSLNTSNVRK